MSGSIATVPAPSRTGLLRSSQRRVVLAVAAVIAASAAMLILATRASSEMLDYSVGIVPLAVPWLAAVLSVTLGVVGASDRHATTGPVFVLMALVGLTTAWSVCMLPFDALRTVGLVPLPLSGWGLGMRLALLVAGVAAVTPVLMARRARQARCAACRRPLPGRLDRLPRWPAIVAVAAALPYPTLRVVWALGGTFGTTGEPLELEPAVAWGTAAVGAVLVAFTIILLVGRGPTWARALFGLGGLVAGLALAMDGGLAAGLVLSVLIKGEAWSSPEAGLPLQTFLLVYGSWFVAGLAIIAASWRYWAHRRDGCPGCRFTP